MRLVVVPDILKQAPVFQAVAEVGASAQAARSAKGAGGRKKGGGRGRAAGGGGGGGQNLFEKRAAKRS